MARVLVADDPSFHALLRDILEGEGHAVVEARDGEEATLTVRVGMRRQRQRPDGRNRPEPGLPGQAMTRRVAFARRPGRHVSQRRPPRRARPKIASDLSRAPRSTPSQTIEQILRRVGSAIR